MGEEEARWRDGGGGDSCRGGRGDARNQSDGERHRERVAVGVFFVS